MLFVSGCGSRVGAPPSGAEAGLNCPAIQGANANSFALTSPEVAECGALPKAFTCDGESATLPLEWRNPPAGVQSFAIVMHHVPGPGDTHWYWVIWDVPAGMTNLPRNQKGVGTLGTNSVNDKAEYSPPCSKGPGAKMYTYTIYALAAPPQINVPNTKVSRDVLLATIKDRTIASAMLNVTYAR